MIFMGSFWALCSIILSFLWLGLLPPDVVVPCLRRVSRKIQYFLCGQSHGNWWQAYGVYSVFQKWRASFCKMSLHHFLKTGICGNFHQQSRCTEAWVSQSRVNPEHKDCNCIYNTVHSPRWCSAQKSGRTSGVLRLLSTLATQTMLWMHLGAGKTMAQFRRWKTLCPTSPLLELQDFGYCKNIKSHFWIWAHSQFFCIKSFPCTQTFLLSEPAPSTFRFGRTKYSGRNSKWRLTAAIQNRECVECRDLVTHGAPVFFLNRWRVN